MLLQFTQRKNTERKDELNLQEPGEQGEYTQSPETYHQTSASINTSCPFNMRLPYISDPPEFKDPKFQDFANRLLKSRPGGRLSPLDLALLHSPPFAKGFMQFFTTIRFKSTLPEDIMELAMCRVGTLNGAAFEWMHHAPLLHKAGVSEQGVETVRTAEPFKVGKDGDGGLSENHWKVLKYVDEMTKNVKVKDETFEAVRGILDERQVVELSEYFVGLFVQFIGFSHR
jgi:alkylhydroperoxidase family enzyme